VAQVLLPLEEQKAVLTPNTQYRADGSRRAFVEFRLRDGGTAHFARPEGRGDFAETCNAVNQRDRPGIERLAKEGVRPGLAISLNASNDEQRNTLMPINRKYPLSTLMKACREYPAALVEYLMFEYVMLGGVNDSLADARRVVKLLAPLQAAKVNLIPWNPGGLLPYHESPPQVIDAFQKLLIERGIPTFVRHSRGRDVMAACGQLALSEATNPPLTMLG